MLAAAAVSACSRLPSAARPGDVDSARGVLQQRLNDYPTARFQHVRLVKLHKVMRLFCGEVSTRDTTGAYGGWRKFYLLPTGNTGIYPSIVAFDDDRGSLTAPIEQMCGVGPEFADAHDYAKDFTFTQ